MVKVIQETLVEPKIVLRVAIKAITIKNPGTSFPRGASHVMLGEKKKYPCYFTEYGVRAELWHHGVKKSQNTYDQF